MNLSTESIYHKLNYNAEDRVIMKGDLLKRYQMELLKMAEDIISVCEEEKITYVLGGGSALGAVRHQGFIPWDDDFDLNILGSDFDRFIEKFTKKFSDKYWIHTCKTPGYGFAYNQIRLKNSVYRGLQDMHKEECGFICDVFRMENVFDNIILRYVHGFFCMGMGLLLSCRNYYNMREIFSKILEENPDEADVFKLKIMIGRCLSFMSVTKWARLTQWVYGLCKNNHSRYVTFPSGRKHYFKEMHKREDLAETVTVDFEGHKWQISKNYDVYLTGLYGDYMKIPPESDREYHLLLELKFPGEMSEGGVKRRYRILRFMHANLLRGGAAA